MPQSISRRLTSLEDESARLGRHPGMLLDNSCYRAAAVSILHHASYNCIRAARGHGGMPCSTMPDIHRRARCRQPDGSVVWRVWAPLSEAVSLVTWPSGGPPRKRAMTPEGDGYFVASADAQRAERGTAVCVPAGRRPRVSRPGVAVAARGRASPLGRLLSRVVPLVGRAVGAALPARIWSSTSCTSARSRRRGLSRRSSRGCRIAALGVTADRADARGPVPRRPRLGLRRRLSLRRAEQLRRPAGLAAAGRRRPPGRPGRVPRRGLQPSRAGGELPASKFGPYFTDRYRTPWGKAINYDGPDSDPVRQFVIDNACYVGAGFPPRRPAAGRRACDLRFQPAAHPGRHPGGRAARGRAARRTVHVIAESDQNDVRLVRPAARGGYGLDGVWSDDFHHSVHALLDRRAGRLLPGFRPPGAVGQGLQRRVRLRRLLQPLPPPPARHAAWADRPHAIRRLRAEPRPGGQPGPRRPLGHAGSAGGAAAGVRPAVALALRAAVVHGRGVRRDGGRSRSSARSAIRD